MTFVKLLRNPVLSEIQVLREQVLCEPVFLRVQYYYITLLMSSRPCSVFVLVRVLVSRVSGLLRCVIVHRIRPFLVMVYRVSWAWLCPCLRKSACEGLYGVCLAWEYKLSFLRRNGLQGLLGALWRVRVKIMLVLQVVPGFLDGLWGGCEALCGVHWA